MVQQQQNLVIDGALYSNHFDISKWFEYFFMVPQWWNHGHHNISLYIFYIEEYSNIKENMKESHQTQKFNQPIKLTLEWTKKAEKIQLFLKRRAI